MSFASPSATPSIEGSEQEQLTPLWNVVLLDDDDHTYDYVIEMLARLFFKTVQEAYNHAVEVDSTGRTVVMTCELEAAEFAKDEARVRALAGASAEEWAPPAARA